MLKLEILMWFFDFHVRPQQNLALRQLEVTHSFPLLDEKENCSGVNTRFMSYLLPSADEV